MKIKDPKQGPSVDYPVFDKRYYELVKMIDKHGIGKTLVFGEKSNFENEISKQFENKFAYTNYNLDGRFPKMEKYDTLFCCEVIEHLLNPLSFFTQARNSMKADSLMYLTYPIQPHTFWCGCHFHEYDKSRFHYLLREAGLEIVGYKEYINWKKLKGIRPIIRNTPLGWLKQQIYVLKRGNLRCDMV